MAFGNRLGVALNNELSLDELTEKNYGAIVLEVVDGCDMPFRCKTIGEVIAEPKFTYAGTEVPTTMRVLSAILKEWLIRCK